MKLPLLLLLDSAPLKEAVQVIDKAVLPSPSRLLVEYLPWEASQPLGPLISAPKPRLSFLPHQKHNHPGSAVAMTAYRIVVKSTGNGQVAWDSGKVNASAAASVTCTRGLDALETYSWTAQWWSGDLASPVSGSKFQVGPMAEADWSKSVWLGAGQNEFRLHILPKSAARIYVAAPGGSVVYDGTGRTIGDTFGLSAWIDYSKSVRYQGYSLPFFRNGSNPAQTLRLAIGTGFWSSKYFLGSSFWGIAEGRAPVARVLVVGADLLKLEGREGRVVFDDPWLGSVTDWTKADEAGWTVVKGVLAADRPAGALKALQVPYASVNGQHALRKMPVAVKQVLPLGLTSSGSSRWLYKFSRNIVGHAIVAPGAVSVSKVGNLTLLHCENINTTLGLNQSTCVHLGQRGKHTHPADRHILPTGFGQGDASVELAGSFSHHGFQYVIVEADAGVHFYPVGASVSAKWVVSDLQESATISFDGPGAELLSKIRDIVKASQLGNMAAYVPTDCPTREKHGFLGDARASAEAAMFNLWSPTVWELFMDEIRFGQETNKSSKYYGFVPQVVPSALLGPPTAPVGPADISWSAAYPLIAHWLLQYFGDEAVVRDHWAAMKRWVDAQKREMKPGDGVPSTFIHGDWCAPFEPRATEMKGTGPAAAASNYILAVEAMVSMAEVIGETSDAKRYAGELAQWRTAYDNRFFNSSTGTYTGDAFEVQTLTSLTLGAAAASTTHRASAIKALIDDIESRDHHITVGSIGQKWIFRELTAIGKHDTALALAMQTTYPSFGYWIANGATTCWENWSGISDQSHPGQPNAPNPPTHNHIFLCGGVGEWIYRSLGGIAPATPGYATVAIAPQISKTAGPNAVNASVLTIRGTVGSSWVRHERRNGPSGECILEMRVSVPVGILARVTIPLLGLSPNGVSIIEQSENVQVWGDHQQRAQWLRTAPRAGAAPSGDATVELQTTAGEFNFEVRRKHIRTGPSNTGAFWM